MSANGGLHDTEDRVQRLEFAIWGLRGDNGLVAEVKALRKELHGWREEERRRREVERETELEDRKKDRRWRLVFGVSVVSAILVAAGILAQALQ